MKKTMVVAVIISLIMQCLGGVSVLADVTLSGDGTAGNPYLIGTLDDLIAFREKVNGGETSACATLTNDIVAGQWTSIGTSENKYAGTFDGSGYSITGIKGAGTNDNAWGLFAYTNGGEIKNLTVSTGTDSTMNIGHRAALIVAFASNDTKITKCAGYGDLSGWGWIGGITYDGACTVTESYYIGNIAGAHNTTAMGLNSTAVNCFAYGDVTATTHAFKISNKSATNCYFLYSKGEGGTGGYGTQKNEEAFASGEVAYLLGDAFGQTIGKDEHPVFKTDDNTVYENSLGGYGNKEAEDGTIDKPYTIATASALGNFRNLVNNGNVSLNAKLGADIDLNNALWTPIGTSENKYAGTFDGADFKISGINGSGNGWGFFGYTNGGEIKNLTIEAGNNGTLNVGHQSAMFVAIASNNTQINKCAGYGNISIKDGYVGGITCQGACIVNDSYFVGDISGVNWVTGMGYNAVATNCFVYGTIKGTSTAFKVANGSGTSNDKNFYFAVDSPGAYGYGTQKSAEKFASGEIAYLLGDAFGQTIGKDKYPVFKTEDNTVYFVNNISYTNDPTEDGSAEKPYTLTGEASLVAFRNAVNAGSVGLNAKLVSDIELSGTWTAIGSPTNKFAGTFDGNGFEITNLKGSGNADNAWGLFAYTNGGEIKNLTVSTGADSATAIGHQAALLVGIASNNTKISNCAGYGDISGWGYIGGIAYNGACTVENCYYVGNIAGAHQVTGMGYDSVAKNCFVYGNITATTNAFKISNNKNTENCYFLSSAGDAGTGGYGTQKSAEAFASGEVAYLINKGAGDIIYGQNIGTDTYPITENDAMVYKKLDGTYSNTEGTFICVGESETVVISATDAIAFIAQYGLGNVLETVNPVTLTAGTKVAPQIIRVNDAEVVKVFIWNSLIELKPVSEVEGYTFQ